jgi:DNA-binding transcriptional MerR regulator
MPELASRDRVFSIAEAARRLGIHPGSLRRAERQGRIPSSRRETLTRTRLFTEAEVEQLRTLIAPRDRR